MNALGTRSGEIHAWLRSNLFDEVPMAISVISRDFRVLEANRRFEEAYGPWRERPCYEVYKGRSEPCLRCAALEVFVDGRIRTREEQGRTGDGQDMNYLVHMVPVTRPNGDIPYIIEMCTDITAVKRLEREKREAERLAAVGETVAGVAHGIKNILMGLEGGMYAVNTGIRKGDDERIAGGWTMLEDNVRRISAFVKEFLDFAKGRTTSVAPVDPCLPARQVMELYAERAAEAGIRLRADLPEGVEPVPLDREGIHTCLANLVSNAIDACLVAEARREFEVVLTCREENDDIVYEVADNGRGMDYEISRKVFSKFFTTKGSDRGTGLGLLTTKRIVHQHRGQITFTSTEGEGSVFRIVLSRGALAELDAQPDQGDEKEKHGGGSREVKP
ncbi:MAG: ATP-binding protein [Gemmatimonadota bacterium]|jgi:signal transduction histidine kinase